MTAEILNKSRVLLGITGGISAYKSAALCRLLVKAGAEVQPIMTRSACEFVTPLTFETLTGRPVYLDMFDRNRAWEIEHIAFAHWGQTLVIAPATANIIAKLAAGIADDPLTTTALAFRGPLVIAPAMNTAMWEHPQTRENVARLRERGARFVEPEQGELACGDTGAGRLAEIEVILGEVRNALVEARATGPLAGKRVLITLGPTVEMIDPVRFLSNPSSGRMGFALAAEAMRLGAQVTEICGPVKREAPPRNQETVINVRSAREMRDAALANLEGQDICVFCAAVSDFAPATPSDTKIKKEKRGRKITLELARTPDVAAEANAARRPGQVFVGFAAESENLEENARRKMKVKGFDVVVGNEISDENPAFGSDSNAVTLLARSGKCVSLPRSSKEALARPIWDFIMQHALGGKLSRPEGKRKTRKRK